MFFESLVSYLVARYSTAFLGLILIHTHDFLSKVFEAWTNQLEKTLRDVTYDPFKQTKKALFNSQVL